MKKKIDIRLLTLVLIILAVGLLRIVQTSSDSGAFSNFTPIGALALFGGAYFTHRVRAYLFPLLVLFISDLVLMNTVYAEHNSGLLYEGWVVVYLAFGMMVFIGHKLITKVNMKSVLLSAILAALTHYIIVDFAVWAAGGTDITTGLPYTRDMEGLLRCYLLALPYLKNMLLGNLFYGALLFGGFEFAQSRFEVLRKAPVTE